MINIDTHTFQCGDGDGLYSIIVDGHSPSIPMEQEIDKLYEKPAVETKEELKSIVESEEERNQRIWKEIMRSSK